MIPLEHSAILLTCIKWYLVLKTSFGLLFKWPLKTGFTVFNLRLEEKCTNRTMARLNRQLWFLITQIIDKSIVPLTPWSLYREIDCRYRWYSSRIDDIAVQYWYWEGTQLYHLNILPELLDGFYIYVTWNVLINFVSNWSMHAQLIGFSS